MIQPISTNLEFSCSWTAPSNIALIKYWGKKGHQIPANPSLSMTLKECVTKTQVSFTPSDKCSVELFFHDHREEKFEKKIKDVIQHFFPFLKIVINTENSFPHGAGIASSASGMSALSLCLIDYLFFASGKTSEAHSDFFQTASYLARLFSGSACRSLYGGFSTWGDESDEYASPLKVHDDFLSLKNSIVIIDDQEKAISSTHGHGRMKEHPFAEARFLQARRHFSQVKDHLLHFDFDAIGDIIEAEALSLHAMMMTSPKSYTLLKPHSLTTMELIRTFRRDTKIPVYFTLDAGPNLHVIYPSHVEEKVKTFLKNELSGLYIHIIHDQVGEGPQKCS